MGTVGTPVIRQIVRVAQGRDSAAELLASAGLSPDPDPGSWGGDAVAEDTYYDLLERAAGDDDHGLPFRYGAALRPDDLGALGLAMKTAPCVEHALQRLIRYVLVLSDTLQYELLEESAGTTFALRGRPPLRRGAALANECALAATMSFLRRCSGTELVPDEVSFRHAAPPTDRFHREFFGCRVSFAAPANGIRLSAEQLAVPMLLADEGLSAYLLAQLDELRSRSSERSVVAEVRSAVADALPDGQPSKSQIARRLGMSERTLHRRLAEQGESFQSLTTRARRDVAESLLGSDHHGVAEVAYLTGFADQSAFTRAFKRWTGQTPAAFRVRDTATASER